MTMRTLIDLIEAPLADFQTFGDQEKEASFSVSDMRHVKKSLVKGIYKKKMGALPFNFYVYLINAKGLDDLGKGYPEAEISMDDLVPYLSQSVRGGDEALLMPLQRAIEYNRRNDPSGIHFIMGDNYSEEGQVPPTSWMIVHRFAHCLQVSSYMNDFDSALTAAVFEARDALGIDKDEEGYTAGLNRLLTMRSATSGNLQHGEMASEVCTQFFMTGQIGLRNLHLLSDRTKMRLITAKELFENKLEQLIHDSQGKMYYI